MVWFFLYDLCWITLTKLPSFFYQQLVYALFEAIRLLLHFLRIKFLSPDWFHQMIHIQIFFNQQKHQFQIIVRLTCLEKLKNINVRIMRDIIRKIFIHVICIHANRGQWITQHKLKPNQSVHAYTTCWVKIDWPWLINSITKID